MNIEKVKNYNQKMLAVFGSLAVMLIAIIIVWVLTEYFNQYTFRNYKNDDEIVSNEKAEENYGKSLRTHQVSFENFQLIDTINAIYLIPVSQTALKMEEFIDKNEKGSGGSSGMLHLSGRYDNYFYNSNSFNNALIYDAGKGSVEKLFDRRISINGIDVEQIGLNYYVLLAATDKDTDENGILDEDDSKTLYVYSVAEKKLKEVEFENGDFLGYEVLLNQDKIMLKYGIDKNNDGVHNWDEPMLMMVYDVRTNTLEHLIPPALIDELQNTLDGQQQQKQ